MKKGFIFALLTVMLSLFAFTACEPDTLYRTKLFSSVISGIPDSYSREIIDTIVYMNPNAQSFSTVSVNLENKTNNTYRVVMEIDADKVFYYFKLNLDYSISDISFSSYNTTYMQDNIYFYKTAKNLGILGDPETWLSLPSSQQDLDDFVAGYESYTIRRANNTFEIDTINIIEYFCYQYLIKNPLPGYWAAINKDDDPDDLSNYPFYTRITDVNDDNYGDPHYFIYNLPINFTHLNPNEGGTYKKSIISYKFFYNGNLYFTEQFNMDDVEVDP